VALSSSMAGSQKTLGADGDHDAGPMLATRLIFRSFRRGLLETQQRPAGRQELDRVRDNPDRARSSTAGVSTKVKTEDEACAVFKGYAPRERALIYVPCVDGSALARTFCTSQVWSEQPCVRPVNAARVTAGHNALRGSGPGQKPALDSAVAHVGCPDLRIDRICITCCWSFPTFTSRRLTDAISLTPQVRRVLCSARPWPSLPKPCAQSYSLARWLPPLSVAAPAAQ
jgi:hypothetical protein